jgi:hypothetical protein
MSIHRIAATNSEEDAKRANATDYCRTVKTGLLDVFGEARPDAKVTITSPAGSTSVFPTIRQDDPFYRQLTVDNSTAAQYRDITITGVQNNVGPAGEDAVTEVTREVFVPASLEAFTPDADGNLTGDARWTYTVDNGLPQPVTRQSDKKSDKRGQAADIDVA